MMGTSPVDIGRITKAVASMRRPEVRLNPVDVGRLFNALAPTELESDRDRQLRGFAEHAPLASVPIVSDASVPAGEMRVIERAPDLAYQPFVFTAPPVVEPEVWAHRDWMLGQVPQVGMPSYLFGVDLGYGQDVATIATLVDGRIVDVRRVRRPWKSTGRKRTRRLWARTGRR